MQTKIALIGGGTMSHVRNHLSLCAPAYGETVRSLERSLKDKLFVMGVMNRIEDIKNRKNITVDKYLTNMAGGKGLETNEDIDHLLDELIADPDVRVIVFNPALVDFRGDIDQVPSGKHAERLRTSEGNQVMRLSPTEKLIGKIRKTRKDIFVVGFKTTTGVSPDEQYVRGLELLKTNSLNLVLANDTVTRNNMIIAPEETRYSETTERKEVLDFLSTMILSRMNNTFTRSTVIEGVPVEWKSHEIPQNLRSVVDHCIENGAYKPFLGKTAGHFAVKVNDGEILTTIRKTNFNELNRHGLVRVEYDSKDTVIAHGAKPSVGGMSQRIIFSEHSDTDCIVHFHCPPKKAEHGLSTKEQWKVECGSHQCGMQTSQGLERIDLGDDDFLKVVYLDRHGPNIVFTKDTPAEKIIAYIDSTFDLSAKTGGLI